MAVTKKSQRKAVQIGWDTGIVSGKYASVFGEEDSGWKEKINVPNDGNALVTYGKDFVGESNLKVKGSAGGEDTGTIEVE